MSFKYIVESVAVEAVPASILEGNETKAIPQWLIAAIVDGTLDREDTCMTKQGRVKVNPTDMLIRLEDGEIYPCAIEVFNAKYQKQD